MLTALLTGLLVLATVVACAVLLFGLLALIVGVVEWWQARRRRAAYEQALVRDAQIAHQRLRVHATTEYLAADRERAARLMAAVAELLEQPSHPRE
jgi:uncharacterized iron-regulated membrane protein